MGERRWSAFPVDSHPRRNLKTGEARPALFNAAASPAPHHLISRYFSNQGIRGSAAWPRFPLDPG